MHSLKNLAVFTRNFSNLAQRLIHLFFRLKVQAFRLVSSATESLQLTNEKQDLPKLQFSRKT